MLFCALGAMRRESQGGNALLYTCSSSLHARTPPKQTCMAALNMPKLPPAPHLLVLQPLSF